MKVRETQLITEQSVPTCGSHDLQTPAGACSTPCSDFEFTVDFQFTAEDLRKSADDLERLAEALTSQEFADFAQRLANESRMHLGMAR